MYNFKPAGDPPTGCDACEYTWSVEYQWLFHSCESWFTDDLSGTTVGLGIDLDDGKLWVYNDSTTGWFEYPYGELGDTDYVGGATATLCTVELVNNECPAGASWDSTEYFMLNW